MSIVRGIWNTNKLGKPNRKSLQSRYRSVVRDGARWIRKRILEHLPYIDAMFLDFFHLGEHIWDTAKCCLGDSDEAGKWAKNQLHEIKHVGPAGVPAAIAKLSKKFRSAPKKKALRLKRTGMKWDPENAAAIMNLVALRESG